ncbi:MAG: prohead protease [Deltaproteobacteria bacterium]|nr:MAG: prohead protease [Deltaproteobacteria bacterium]
MILITTHQNADFDGFASMIAAHKLYPEATLAFPGAREQNVQDYIDHHPTYPLEIRQHSDIDLTAVDTLVVVDTTHSSRIGRFSKCLDNDGLKLHIYSHIQTKSGDLVGAPETVRKTGSTTTLLVEKLCKQGVSLSQEEATLLALGIYENTGSLTHLTTTPEDLQAAAWLLQQGAQLDRVVQFINQELTTKQIGILNELTKKTQRYTIHDVHVSVVAYTQHEYSDDFPQISRRLMAMENLNVLFALIAMGTQIYLIGRSRIADVNVGAIVREFGGGGHATVASAAIKNATLNEIEERLISVLYQHIQPQPVASEMMSTPAITVEPTMTILEAREILTRYNITAAPVQDLNTKEDSATSILGIVSIRMVEKAVHHGLGERPVADYMTSDVKALPLHASLSDVQELIIENRQRLVPILDGQRLTGIITRTDLLNRLVNDPANLPKNLLYEADTPPFTRTKNLNQLIIDTLPREMIQLLQKIGETADSLGYRVYAVGGFVRDLLLQKENLDLDIVVEGDGIAFAKAFAVKMAASCLTHERFRTANVSLQNGFSVDIATARLEYYEHPAAMPTVELSSIKLDLSRRDFTINAMAIHLNPAHFGTLIDFFNSQADLQKKSIRVLHNLSFVEDPSRIFRAVRFEGRMGFTISVHTERLIKNAVDMELFGKSNDTRFLAELKYILSEKNPLPALQRLKKYNLFQFLWPEFSPSGTTDRQMYQDLQHTLETINWFEGQNFEESCENWMVYLLVLMSESTIGQLSEFCNRFEESTKTTTFLKEQKEKVREKLRIFNNTPTMAHSRIVALLEGVGIEGLLYMMSIAKRDHIKERIVLYLLRLRAVRPRLSGKDLIGMGYKPGPRFTVILTALKNARLDQKTQSKADERALLKEKFPLSQSG